MPGTLLPPPPAYDGKNNFDKVEEVELTELDYRNRDHNNDAQGPGLATPDVAIELASEHNLEIADIDRPPIDCGHVPGLSQTIQLFEHRSATEEDELAKI